MKTIILAAAFFFVPVILQAQDTIPKQFDHFFGSDCDLDTVILQSVKNSEIIFYKNEGRLMRVKNGRVKWESDYKKFCDDHNHDSLCVIQRGVEGKPRKTVVLVIPIGSSDSEDTSPISVYSVSGKPTVKRKQIPGFKPRF